MIQIPLYSRGRPLKNLLTDWKKLTGNDNILVPTDYEYNSEVVQYVEPDEYGFYQRTINYWYFSEIGFDSDDRFIKRFNDIYGENIDYFKKLYLDIIENGFNYEKIDKILTSNGSNDSNSTDTNTRAGTVESANSGSDTIQRSESSSTLNSGSDIFNKGVTTTNHSETSNTGNKLGRNTPNEQLGVVGTSDTTVADSGYDETEYGKTETRTGTHTDTHSLGSKNTNTYNLTDTASKIATLLKNETINDKTVRNTLSVDEYKSLLKIKSIFREFAMLFENIFMGVY